MMKAIAFWLVGLELLGTAGLATLGVSQYLLFNTPYRFKLAAYPLGDVLWAILHYGAGIDVSWL